MLNISRSEQIAFVIGMLGGIAFALFVYAMVLFKTAITDHGKALDIESYQKNVAHTQR